MSRIGGWSFEIIPGRPLRHTDDGRLALPLRISRNGQNVLDAEMILRTDQLQDLHATIGRILGGTGPYGGKKGCHIKGVVT